MNATASRRTMPKPDRISRLFGDMINERGRELAALPPTGRSNHFELRRREHLTLAIADLRRDLSRQILLLNS